MTALTGSCLCGGVRFEVTEPFRRVTQCHCASCKKLSGGPGTVNGQTGSAAIRVLSGADLLQTYRPDEGTAKTFCRNCGSNLFGGGWPQSELASVRLSALDAPLERKPELHIFTRSVAPWETLPEDGAPRYDVRPPS
ncbi:MAG TPA: GFA family protein [Gaiellaceae bacterium]|nr:GFA family protein [Gaiellaceae bacterium]